MKTEEPKVSRKSSELFVILGKNFTYVVVSRPQREYHFFVSPHKIYSCSFKQGYSLNLNLTNIPVFYIENMLLFFCCIPIST
jgi:hypothetical protein